MCTGVRQGCVLSPLLFNTVVDVIMRKVFTDRHGTLYDANQSITDLMYADDSAIFADEDHEASLILRDIQEAARPFGLKINTDKTKVLTTDGSPGQVFLDGVQLEQVPQFKYLGSIIREGKVAASEDVKSRIGAAATAFGAPTWCLWRKTNISLETKMRPYRSLIL